MIKTTKIQHLITLDPKFKVDKIIELAKPSKIIYDELISNQSKINYIKKAWSEKHHIHFTEEELREIHEIHFIKKMERHKITTKKHEIWFNQRWNTITTH